MKSTNNDMNKTIYGIQTWNSKKYTRKFLRAKDVREIDQFLLAIILACLSCDTPLHHFID
jgi:hypothetical protein